LKASIARLLAGGQNEKSGDRALSSSENADNKFSCFDPPEDFQMYGALENEYLGEEYSTMELVIAKCGPNTALSKQYPAIAAEGCNTDAEIKAHIESKVLQLLI
jgi:hypothetical protein